MPLKLKPTVLDRLKELEGDAKARRISEALPILASGITPMEPCICVHETHEAGGPEIETTKTYTQIEYALENGVATLKPYDSDRVYLIVAAESHATFFPGGVRKFTATITLDGHDPISYEFFVRTKGDGQPTHMRRAYDSDDIRP